MALRPVFDKEGFDRAYQRVVKLVGRAYVIWLLGIAVGALELKATSFSLIGANFILAKPELIEGILYVGCVCAYVTIFWEAATTSYTPVDRYAKRKAIYQAVKKRRGTLKGKTSSDLTAIMHQARKSYRIIYWVGALGVMLPLLHILIFRRDPLWKALLVIISKVS